MNHTELVQLFIKKSSDPSASRVCGSMSFRNRTLFSYAMPIAQRAPDNWTGGGSAAFFMVDDSQVPSRTTARHLRELWYALPGTVCRFEVKRKLSDWDIEAPSYWTDMLREVFLGEVNSLTDHLNRLLRVPEKLQSLTAERSSFSTDKELALGFNKGQLLDKDALVEFLQYYADLLEDRVKHRGGHNSSQMRGMEVGGAPCIRQMLRFVTQSFLNATKEWTSRADTTADEVIKGWQEFFNKTRNFKVALGLVSLFHPSLLPKPKPWFVRECVGRVLTGEKLPEAVNNYINQLAKAA